MENHTNLIKQYYDRISKIQNNVDNFMIQVEGSTCSGKTTLIKDVSDFLKKRGCCVEIIEEAATKVFVRNKSLFQILVKYSEKSERWIKVKKNLQRKILVQRCEDIIQFLKRDYCDVLLVDRGGASIAYHTIPFLSVNESLIVENLCRKISNMSAMTFFLENLGFLNYDTLRYQKTLYEIVLEENGIKKYLQKWKIPFTSLKALSIIERRNLMLNHIDDARGLIQ